MTRRRCGPLRAAPGATVEDLQMVQPSIAVETKKGRKTEVPCEYRQGGDRKRRGIVREEKEEKTTTKTTTKVDKVSIIK